MQSESSVTVVASRVVNADAADTFRAWAARVDEAVSRIEGHRGNVRLMAPGGLFHLVYQFETQDGLAQWEGSDDYARLMRQGEGFSIQLRQVKAGGQAWFDIPGEGSAAKWRQALMTWSMVFPLLLILNGLISLLPVTFPQPVRLGASSMVMTCALTWIILPRVSRWLRPWMLSDGRGHIRDAG